MGTILLPMLIVLFVLLIIGVPVGLTFALAGFAGGLIGGYPIGTITSSAYYALNSFSLLSIPLFILAGEMMNRGKLIDRLVDLNELSLFWLPGRMGHVTIVSSAFLGAMTGSSVATVAAISSSMGAKMTAKGYKRGYVASLCAASGLLGVLIPPSIPLIVYGATVGVSVPKLFLATLVPGIIMTLAYMVLHMLMLNKVLDVNTLEGEQEKTVKHDRGVFVGAPVKFLKSLPAIFMVVIVLGSIYSGLATPTESAALAGLYALVIILLGKAIKIGDLPSIFTTSARTAGAIMCIIGFTSVFNKMLTLMRIPQEIAEFTANLTESKLVFLLLANILLFLIGMFMETNAAVMLMAPLLYPAAVQMGIDPVHFGIILVTNIEIGLLTPPMASNIYVSAKINKSSLPEMMPYVLRFVITSVLILVLITYVPAISLWWQ